jgi:hypothetical protein
MILPLKKGNTHIDVFYTNDFSHNLYCSDFKFIKEQIKGIELSFEHILRSRTDSNSKYDLNDFIDNKDEIEIIKFSDKTLKKSLLRKFEQNELVNLRVIAGKIIDLQMNIVFNKMDEFELRKPATKDESV